MDIQKETVCDTYVYIYVCVVCMYILMYMSSMTKFILLIIHCYINTVVYLK